MKTLCSKISNYIKTLVERNHNFRTTTLKDGSIITRPFSYSIMTLALTFAVIFFFWNMIVTRFFSEFGARNFFQNIPNFFTIIKSMVVDVNWSYFSNILGPMADTIRIAVIGTAVGSLIAVPVAILASQNIMGKSRIPGVVKFFLSIIRTFPLLVYALILSYIFGSRDIIPYISNRYYIRLHRQFHRGALQISTIFL